MSDLPTLKSALKLADQDSPLPSLAGPALKVLRETIEGLQLGLTIMSRRLLRQANDGQSPSTTGRVPNVWRPIATAPTDGTLIVGCDPEWLGDEFISPFQVVCFDRGAWRYAAVEYTHEPTLWKPIDAPPTVIGIDYGTHDKTVEALGHMDAEGRMDFAEFVESEPNGPNSGHGHVRPRPDGVKARCGGPAMCKVCWNEQLNIERSNLLRSLVKMPAVKIGDWVKVACDEAGDPSVTVIPESELYTCTWCLTCHPQTWTNRLFVVCPTCGNKRCPHANDHRNACTGSNAVGQLGSSWEHVKPTGDNS